MTLIAIADIDVDAPTQLRADGLHLGQVKDYAEAMRRGDTFPPVPVFQVNGGYWPGEGFHRIAARREAGFADIEADVREGGEDAAMEFALSANFDNGLPRSSADKRNAVRAANLNPKYSCLPNTGIADLCKVSVSLARTVRKAMVREGAIEELDVVTTTRADGTTVEQPATKERKAPVVAKTTAPKVPLTDEQKKVAKGVQDSLRKPKSQFELDRERLAEALETINGFTFDGTAAWGILNPDLDACRLARDWLDEVIEAALQDSEAAA